MRALWRRMSEADLPAVNAIGDRVHLQYPEDEAVVAERLRLYPRGCFVLELEGDVAGYVISHPWHFKRPPALNALLGAVPDPGTTYYLHDLALLPPARGNGAASRIVGELIAHTRESGFPNASLIAVNNSRGFWEQHGFRVVSDASLNGKLRTYDAHARFMVRDISP